MSFKFVVGQKEIKLKFSTVFFVECDKNWAIAPWANAVLCMDYYGMESHSPLTACLYVCLFQTKRMRRRQFTQVYYYYIFVVSVSSHLLWNHTRTRMRQTIRSNEHMVLHLVTICVNWEEHRHMEERDIDNVMSIWISHKYICGWKRTRLTFCRDEHLFRLLDCKICHFLVTFWEMVMCEVNFSCRQWIRWIFCSVLKEPFRNCS